MRYGKYYAVISLVSCEPIWGTVTCLGEQAVVGGKTMQVTMEKQVFLHCLPHLFPGLSNLWRVTSIPS